MDENGLEKNQLKMPDEGGENDCSETFYKYRASIDYYYYTEFIERPINKCSKVLKCIFMVVREFDNVRTSKHSLLHVYYLYNVGN